MSRNTSIIIQSTTRSNRYFHLRLHNYNKNKKQQQQQQYQQFRGYHQKQQQQQQQQQKKSFITISIPKESSSSSSSSSLDYQYQKSQQQHNVSQPQLQQRRRVVVTGIGAVTPLGINFQETWDRLVSENDSNSTTTNNNNNTFITIQEALQQQLLPNTIYNKELLLCNQLPCQIVGCVDKKYTIPYNIRTSRCVQLALHATQNALIDSQLLHKLIPNTDDNTTSTDEQLLTRQQRERVGVYVGNAMSSVRTISHAALAAYTNDTTTNDTTKTTKTSTRNGYRTINPYFVLNCLPNTSSGTIANTYNVYGPNHTISTACATGGHSIGEAYQLLSNVNSPVDIMICGSTESCIDPLSIGAFCRINAMPNTTSVDKDDTTKIQQLSKPFDTNRSGFIMSEGSCILIIEELQHAIQRNVSKIYGEIIGYTSTCDGYHITSPDPQYKSTQHCLYQSLYQYQNQQNQRTSSNTGTSTNIKKSIGYINAHATSTPMGDEIEAQCIYDTIKKYVKNNNTNSDDKNNIPSSNDKEQNQSQQSTSSTINEWYVSSTKGATGHMLGASGSIEAAFAVMSLHEQIIPHTKNLHTIDTNCSFDHTIRNNTTSATDVVVDDYNNTTSTSTNTTSTSTSTTNFTIEHVTNQPLSIKSLSLQPQNTLSAEGTETSGTTASSVSVSVSVSAPLSLLDVAISNSFGFGGTNSCLVFQRYDYQPKKSQTEVEKEEELKKMI